MKKTILTCAAASIMLFACKKEDVATVVDTVIPLTALQESANDEASAEDDAFAEDIFESTQSIVDEGVNDPSNPSAKLEPIKPGNCSTKTVKIDSTLKTATITYTFSADTCDDGKLRTGKIILTANKKNLRDSGAVLTMTFDNYTINGHKIEAKRTLTNLSTIGALKGMHQSVKVTGADGTGSATITKKDGSTVKWYAEKIRKQINGKGTLTRTDDTFEISGKQGGTSSKGHAYSTVITSPITIDNGCKNFPAVSGVRTVTRGTRTFTIDFGTGTCDNVITITKDGVTKEVSVGVNKPKVEVKDTTTTGTTTGNSLIIGSFSIDGIVYTKKGGSNSSEGSDDKGTGRTTSYYQTGTTAYCKIIFGNRSSKAGTYKINATETFGTNLASDEVFITVKDSGGKMHIAQSGTLVIGTYPWIYQGTTYHSPSFTFTDIPTESGKISANIAL